MLPVQTLPLGHGCVALDRCLVPAGSLLTALELVKVEPADVQVGLNSKSTYDTRQI
jgi:hypothetical protein